jgi:hypothetical protein
MSTQFIEYNGKIIEGGSPTDLIMIEKNKGTMEHVENIVKALNANYMYNCTYNPEIMSKIEILNNSMLLK